VWRLDKKDGRIHKAGEYFGRLAYRVWVGFLAIILVRLLYRWIS
jgi:hypothetical protein